MGAEGNFDKIYLDEGSHDSLRLETGEVVDKTMALGVVSALMRIRDAGHTSALLYATTLPSESELLGGTRPPPEQTPDYEPLRRACLTVDWDMPDGVRGQHMLLDDVAAVVRAAVQVNEKHPFATRIDPNLERLATQSQSPSARIGGR